MTNETPIEEMLADLRSSVRARRLDTSETPRADLIKKRLEQRAIAEERLSVKTKGEK